MERGGTVDPEPSLAHWVRFPGYPPPFLMQYEWQLIWILASHFLADFVCQPRWIGEQKSKSNRILFYHIALYTSLMVLLLVPLGIDPRYALLNGVIHASIDFVSSRLTTYFYTKQRFQAFWNVIAADQFLHLAFLVGLLPVLS